MTLRYRTLTQGKTDQSHPKGAAPEGLYYTHTSSHWQGVYSFIAYVKKVIIPYRERIIHENDCPSDQKMLLMLDLHGSHKKCLKHDTNVTKLLADNHIICIFIPAGCTDIYQVMDVVVNFMYKGGVRKEYLAHLHELLSRHAQNPATVNEPMIIDFSMRVLKPLISRFVARGVQELERARSAETFIQLQGLTMEEREYYHLNEVYDVDNSIDETESDPLTADNANHDTENEW